MSAVHAIDPHVHARRWWILTVLCTSLMIVIVGNTTLNVALPTMSRELDASNSQLQWMVDAYALVFAGLLFTAGALGDRFGRKGALQLGLAVFLGGSLYAAFSTEATSVIGGRAIMGVGAAFIMPATLSILANVFSPAERPRAIAIWAGISGGGAAIGPVMSGLLLDHFWYGSVFLVNLPIIALALVSGKILLPTSRDPDQSPLDPPGALLSIAALGSLVYAIIEAPHRGWLSGETLLWFGLSAGLLVAFITWERRAVTPMLDLRYFNDRRFSLASGGMTMVFFAMFGVFFLVTQYFQLVLGFSTVKAGLLQLPFSFVIMMVAPRGPKLVARFGLHRVVGVGLGFVAGGLLGVSFLQSDSPTWLVVAVPCNMAFGMALTMSPLTTLIMSAVPLGKAGVGSATNDTTRELGGALGVAVLGSIVSSRYTHLMDQRVAALPDEVRDVAGSGLAGALAVARNMGEAGADLAAAAREAFMSGYAIAARIGSAAALTAAVTLYLLLPRRADVHLEGHAVHAEKTRDEVEPAAQRD